MIFPKLSCVLRITAGSTGASLAMMVPSSRECKIRLFAGGLCYYDDDHAHQLPHLLITAPSVPSLLLDWRTGS